MNANRNGFLAKTSVDSSVPKKARTSRKSSSRWQTSGMMQGGVVYPLQIAGRPTDAKGSGSSQGADAIWPTIKASDGPHGGPNQRGSKGDPALSSEVLAWPTPQAQDSKVVTPNGSPYTSLAKSLWTTPDASVINDGESFASFRARQERLKATHQNGNGAGMPLAVACLEWPTPVVSDMRNNASPSTAERNTPQLGAQVTKDQNMRLNPDWVEALMGWPIGWTRTLMRPAGPLAKARCSTVGNLRASSSAANPPEEPKD